MDDKTTRRLVEELRKRADVAADFVLKGTPPIESSAMMNDIRVISQLLDVAERLRKGV